jgi:hypothetical protein
VSTALVKIGIRKFLSTDILRSVDREPVSEEAKYLRVLTGRVKRVGEAVRDTVIVVGRTVHQRVSVAGAMAFRFFRVAAASARKATF